MEHTNNKYLYSVTEVSKLLGIGKNKVYALIKNGYLKALDLGGLKVPRTAIEGFIADNIGFDFTDINNVCLLEN